MNPLGRAYTTLFWAGLLGAAALLLVDRARADVEQARAIVSDERARRIAAEDQAQQALRDLDAATAPPEGDG